MTIGDLLGKHTSNKNNGDEQKVLPKLTPGMKVEVMTLKNRLIFLGHVEQVTDKFVQIVDDLGGNVPYVEFNSLVKIRGFASSRAFCLQGSIGGSTKRLWRVENLSTLQSGERRGYFRQNVNLKAALRRVHNPFEKREVPEELQEPAVDCHVSNISATGVMVESKAVFEEGDWFQLLDVKVCAEERPFVFTCSVRRMAERAGIREYGCEFYELDGDEQERLIKCIMRLQRDEFKARRSGPDDL